MSNPRHKHRAPPLSGTVQNQRHIRKTGIAFDLDEHTNGVSAAAFAFLAPSGLVYSISLPVPSHRFVLTRDTLVAALEHTQGRVETALARVCAYT